MSRPPNMPREEKIRRTRIFVAEHVLETGGLPSVRKLATTLGYKEGGAARVYDAIRNLCSDDRLYFVDTDWQNFCIPTEIVDAMKDAARAVLEKENGK